MAAEVSKPDFSYQWSSGGAIVAPSNVKIQTGWTAEVPPFQWENYLQNRQDNAILHLFQKGISEWDSLSNYYFTASGVRSYVQGSDGNIYVAVQDNIAQDPTTDTTYTYWKRAFSTPEETLLRSGVVGSAKNVRMSVAGASSSANLTADEIIVKSALGGNSYILPSFSKTINIATSGAGGMDTGVGPASGYVGIYAIYNPTTGVSALLAVNATAVAVSEIYGGVNMPAGYTASALVSVWPTNSSSQFIVGSQIDREVLTPFTLLVSTATQIATLTALSTSSYAPKNSKYVAGFVELTVTNAGSPGVQLAGSSTGVGGVQITGLQQTNIGAVQVPFRNIPELTQQVIYWTATIVSGTFVSAKIYLSSYLF